MAQLIGVETSVPDGNLLVVKSSLESGIALLGKSCPSVLQSTTECQRDTSSVLLGDIMNRKILKKLLSVL